MEKRYNKEKFIDFLERLDKKLKQHIYVIVLGGTALSLLGLKSRTKDIDFFVKDIDFDTFNPILEEVISETIPKDKVDYWIDGEMVFVKGGWSESRLPPDYSAISLDYQSVNLENITLKILNPVDLVITKVGRLDEQDIKDIHNLIGIYKIDKTFLETRFNYFLNSFTGNKFKLSNNFNNVCKEVYGDKNAR